MIQIEIRVGGNDTRDKVIQQFEVDAIDDGVRWGHWGDSRGRPGQSETKWY